MKTSWDKVQLFASIGICHLLATAVVNIYAVFWFVSKYEHAQMMMETGKRVALPIALVALESLGKALMYPIVPLLYAWEPTSKIPIGLAVILNSSFVSLLILIVRNKMWKEKIPQRNAFR